MKKYKSHKTVEAFEIIDIGCHPSKLNLWSLCSAGVEVAVDVTDEWMDKHGPKLGGYFVRYEDGYESYSPPDVFEAGYLPVEDAPLTLGDFREANRKRALNWHPDGIECWSLSDWAVAVMGELGELCGDIKCLNRSRDGLVGNKKTDEELRASIPKEIADVFTYLDLLAEAAGVNLTNATRGKFNEISERNGFPDRL